MKVMTVGFLDATDIEDIDGQPACLLVGTEDEIRACGALLYQRVAISAEQPNGEDKGTP